MVYAKGRKRLEKLEEGQKCGKELHVSCGIKSRGASGIREGKYIGRVPGVASTHPIVILHFFPSNSETPLRDPVLVLLIYIPDVQPSVWNMVGTQISVE